MLQRISMMREELKVRGQGLQPLISRATRTTETEDAKIAIFFDTKEDKEEEILRSLENWRNLRWRTLKTTPEEGDEGFEGPLCKQLLGKYVEPFGKDVETLSNKVENRAVQGTSARVLESVRSDFEEAGTANATLEDGELKEVVAPVKKEASEETSPMKTKARIHGDKADEGTNQEMLGYMTKQLVASLSEKANDATIGALSEKVKNATTTENLSNKAKEFQNQEETLNDKIEEIHGRNDIRKASEDEEDDELLPSQLAAPECMKSHVEQKETRTVIKFKIKDLDEGLNKTKSGIPREKVKLKSEDFKKIEDPKRHRYAYKTCGAEAPKRADFMTPRSSSHECEFACNQRGKEAPMKSELGSHMLTDCEERLTEVPQKAGFKKPKRRVHR